MRASRNRKGKDPEGNAELDCGPWIGSASILVLITYCMYRDGHKVLQDQDAESLVLLTVLLVLAPLTTFGLFGYLFVDRCHTAVRALRRWHGIRIAAKQGASHVDTASIMWPPVDWLQRQLGIDQPEGP